jgi:hypothetical protein
MKHPRYFLAPGRRVPVLLAVLSLLASGCASVPQDTCVQFDGGGKNGDYSTEYSYSGRESETAATNFKALPRGRSAYVRLYTMYLAPSRINPCSYLTIHKNLYIQLRARTRPVLEEVREFYTAGGTLIATRTESVGDRLDATGYYTGDTSLPIPPNAPLGKYRIVSKLVLKTKYKNKQRVTVLGKTSAAFEIVPRK